MNSSSPTSYDEVPYDSFPFAQTHPDRLATIAALLGLKPAAVEKCRVLELGCASGGNLLPMAVALPDSSFVGVDLSQVQVEQGQAVIDALNLKNIALRCMSILDVGTGAVRGSPDPAPGAVRGSPDPAPGRPSVGAAAGSGDPRRTEAGSGDPRRTEGQFDYIICHGVYSWVPNEVQDKILAVCHDNLAPGGVAYVSYNTFPGWHMRAMIRDMVSYHARQFAGPEYKIKQARNLLDFLAKSSAKEQTPYSLLLKSEVESIRRSNDSYLFHEHLEDVNDPIYFYEFAERAKAKGLQYLGEVDLRVMVPSNFPPEIENVLQMLAHDNIHMEQYMDFLRNRMFRQTLLCHKDERPNYGLNSGALGNLHIASRAKPEKDDPDLKSNEQETFRTPDGITIHLRDPIVKAAFLHMSEIWPASVPFAKLVDAGQRRLQRSTKENQEAKEAESQVLGQTLLSFYASASTNLVELSVSPPRFTLSVNAKPVACPLARHQAERGNQVTNRRHESVFLGEAERRLLRCLDGDHDYGKLEKVLGDVESDMKLATILEQLARHALLAG